MKEGVKGEKGGVITKPEQPLVMPELPDVCIRHHSNDVYLGMSPIKNVRTSST